MSESLFPLEVAPFEYYMLLDDRREYPMTFVLDYDFDGTFQREPFERAVAEVVGRQPLLQAVIEARDTRRPRWVAAPDPQVPIDWDLLEAPMLPAGGEYLDLTQQVGMRIWVRQGDDRSRVVFQFHHACCDGIGGIQVIGRILSEYSAQLGQQRGGRSKPLEPTRLLRRGDLKPGGSEPPPPAWQAIRDYLREVYRALTRTPSTLAVPPDRAADLDYPGIVQGTAPLEPLRTRARELDVTINDILVRDLFLALDDWNRKYGDVRERWLRVNMPTNLRALGDNAMPAANMLGYAFLTRHQSECRRPETLLDALHHDTEAIKKWRLGAYFLDSIRWAQWLPGASALFASSRQCFATAVLTNVADPSKHFGVRLPRENGKAVVGDLTLRNVRGVPPLRPKTHAGISIMTYDELLRINVRCDPHQFDRAATEELVDRYMDRINAP